MTAELDKLIDLVQTCSKTYDKNRMVSCEADEVLKTITITTKSPALSENGKFVVTVENVIDHSFGWNLTMPLKNLCKCLNDAFKEMKNYEFSTESDFEPIVYVTTSTDTSKYFEFVLGSGSTIEIQFLNISAMSSVAQGNYITRNSSKASVWEWGRNFHGIECWLGTVEGIGFGTWDKYGLDLSSDNRYDLIENIKDS